MDVSCCDPGRDVLEDIEYDLIRAFREDTATAELVRDLVGRGASPNAIDNYAGWSCLSAAAEWLERRKFPTMGQESEEEAKKNSELETVRRKGALDALLSHGADLNVSSPHVATPVMCCAQAGNADVLAWLLYHGADVNKGGAVLIQALEYKGKDVVDLLLNRGEAEYRYSPAPSQVCSINLSATDAVGYDLFSLLDDHLNDITRAIELFGKDQRDALQKCSKKTDPPLCFAAMYGHEDLAKACLSAGVSPTKCCRVMDGTTSLEICLNPRKRFKCDDAKAQTIGSLMVTEGTFEEEDRETATTVVRRFGTSAMFDTLMARGIVRTKRRREDEEGSSSDSPEYPSAKEFADAAMGNVSGLRHLMEMHDYKAPTIHQPIDVGVGPHPCPIHVGVGHSCEKELLHLFKKAGVNINIQDGDGATPLHWSVHANEGQGLSVSNLLEVFGDEVNLEAKNKDGQTAFILAMSNPNFEAANALLEAGCDVHVRNPEEFAVGMSALHHAAEFGSEEMIKLLIEKEIALTTQDDKGNTPLHYAVQERQHNIAALVCNKEAMALRNSEGKTAKDLDVSGDLNSLWEKYPA